jgi:hypothetical protein
VKIDEPSSEKSNGRLGLSKIPKTIMSDVPFPVELDIPNVHVVSLVAGGMYVINFFNLIFTLFNFF